jgi:hypothetical protein
MMASPCSSLTSLPLAFILYPFYFCFLASRLRPLPYFLRPSMPTAFLQHCSTFPVFITLHFEIIYSRTHALRLATRGIRSPTPFPQHGNTAALFSVWRLHVVGSYRTTAARFLN